MAMRYAKGAGHPDEWPQYLQWGEDRQLAAVMHDILRLVPSWKKDPPPAWKRPGDHITETNKKPMTVAELFSKIAGSGAGHQL